MSEVRKRDIKAFSRVEPDLVERIFEYLLTEFPALGDDPAGFHKVRAAVRAEFAGEDVYIPRRGSQETAELASRVLRLFNGRNAKEVASQLGLSRRTVYRYLKQAAQ